MNKSKIKYITVECSNCNNDVIIDYNKYDFNFFETLTDDTRGERVERELSYCVKCPICEHYEDIIIQELRP